MLFWDLETEIPPVGFSNGSNDRIMFASIYPGETGEVEVHTWFPITGSVQHESEKHLVAYLLEWLCKPNVTYNGTRFDWPFLRKRAKLYGLEIPAEQIHYDLYFICKRLLDLPNYKLDTVGKYLLGEGKCPVDFDEYKVICTKLLRKQSVDVGNLIKYSAQDTLLLCNIWNKITN